MNAPVAVFVYNRPDHLRRVLDALGANRGFDDTFVFVYSDGPRTAADEDLVQQVRGVVGAFGRRNVKLIESTRNQGIACSIRSGVAQLTDELGRVVVLEDDLVTSSYFLEYMNAALERYRECENVLQVCGFLPGGRIDGTPDSFFVPLSSSWGWATWQRAWAPFSAADLDPGLEKLRHSASLRRRFDLEGHYPMYLSLRRSATGRFGLRRSAGRSPDSWAVWWQLHLFLTEGLALWPSRSLVRNIGGDGSGAHSRRLRRDATSSVDEVSHRPVLSFPTLVKVDTADWNKVLEAFDATHPKWYRWLSSLTRAARVP